MSAVCGTRGDRPVRTQISCSLIRSECFPWHAGGALYHAIIRLQIFPGRQKRNRAAVYFHDGFCLLDPGVNEIGKLVVALSAKPAPIPVTRSSHIAMHLALLMGFRALEVCALEWAAINLQSETPTATVTKSKTRAGL
jgi:hypothetical protein